jgi:hypothetical protein
MPRPLRIPAALAFTVLSVAAAACGEDQPPPEPDAACRFCVPSGPDNGNCPFPTCATGSNQDQCPPGCMPMPVV